MTSMNSVNSMTAMNSSLIGEDGATNKTLLWKLLKDYPDFVDNVPAHWLAQEPPTRYIQRTIFKKC
jgi:hypothetical protein